MRSYTSDNFSFTNTSIKEMIQEERENLRDSRGELVEKEKEALQEMGYKPVVIDDVTVFVPVGMTVQQLQQQLQQIHPKTIEQGDVVKRLVSDEDLKKIKEYHGYQSVVEKRKSIINEIRRLYQKYWDQEIAEMNDKERQIAKLLLYVEQNINSDVLADISTYDQSFCKQFNYDDGIVRVERPSQHV